MLSLGFKDQIYDVFRLLPSEIQVILISATMPVDVLGRSDIADGDTWRTGCVGVSWGRMDN